MSVHLLHCAPMGTLILVLIWVGFLAYIAVTPLETLQMHAAIVWLLMLLPVLYLLGRLLF